MTKANNLPSFEPESPKPNQTKPSPPKAKKSSGHQITAKKSPPRTNSRPDPTQPAEPATTGYIPRRVDVKLNRAQAIKLRDHQRALEDKGATLADGSVVNNRRRAILWILEHA